RNAKRFTTRDFLPAASAVGNFDAMFGRLIPKDQEFFALFDELATHLATSARLLCELFDQPTLLGERVRLIKGVEHKAHQLVNASAIEVKRIEEEGDALYHEAVGALFDGRPDPLDVIRWKEIYDTLEATIDSCMGVVHAVQSISLKNA